MQIHGLSYVCGLHWPAVCPFLFLVPVRICKDLGDYEKLVRKGFFQPFSVCITLNWKAIVSSLLRPSLLAHDGVYHMIIPLVL